MKFNKILRKWCQVWCPGPKERARMWKVLKESFFSRYGQYLKEADGMSEQYAVEAETWLIFLKWKKKGITCSGMPKQAGKAEAKEDDIKGGL